MNISVVIPAVSPAPMLSATLSTVHEQSHQPAEIIVVDDGLSREQLAPLRGVTTVRGPRRGAGAARNAGVARASGDVVAFLDADDLWDPDHLAMTAQRFNDLPMAAVCFGGAVHVSDDGAVLARFVPRARDATVSGLLRRKLQPTTSATSVSRRAFKEVGGFYEGFRRPAGVEDIDLWWRLARQGTCIVQPTPRVRYVVHQDRDAVRSETALHDLSRDWRLCSQRVHAVISGPLARAATANHYAIMARYWYAAGHFATGRREAAASLRSWPTAAGLSSLVYGTVPSATRKALLALARTHRRRTSL